MPQPQQNKRKQPPAGAAGKKPPTKKQEGNEKQCKTDCPIHVTNRTKINPYRIFISYSHDDNELAGSLITHLKGLGLFPITDREIRIGEAFSEEIRDMIECAHVFMPLVTESANDRLWVQQEIGYATALHVPVYPLMVVDQIKGMHEHIQGINIASDKAQDLDAVKELIRERLIYENVEDLVQRAQRRPKTGRYACAMYWVERQETLATLTEAALKEGCKLKNSATEKVDAHFWRLRQYTPFGSFSIPDANTSSRAWSVRDYDRYQTPYERHLLRWERKAMEDYMNCFGCDMIISPLQGDKPQDEPDCDDPTIISRRLGRAFRLRLLIDFIHAHCDNDKLRVVIPEHEERISGSLFIVGDWFAAEAVLPRDPSATYDRTMFTRHAPTVLNMIAHFDQNFKDSHPKDDKDHETVKLEALDKLCEHYTTMYDKLAPEQKNTLDSVCQELGVKEPSEISGKK